MNTAQYIGVIFDVHCGLLNIIDDYNSLISDIFQIILLNVWSLEHYLSNVMYECPIK